VDDDRSSEQTEPAAEGPVASDPPPDRSPAPHGQEQPPAWQPPAWPPPPGEQQPSTWAPPTQQPPLRQTPARTPPAWPPPDARQAATPQRPARPHGTRPAGTLAPPAAGQTFGTARGLRPGEVPWHGRDVLFAVLIAAAPIATLTVIGTVASGSASAASQTPTAAYALAAIVSTVLVDGWLVFWAWFYSLRKYRLSLASYGFRGFEEAGSWAVAAAVIVAGVLATTVLGTVSDYAYRKVVGPVPKENVVTIFPHTSAGLVLFVVLAVVVAPLLEETFFRGFVFQGLARSWGPLAGALTSALIFAAWHQQLSVLIPIFGLGILLAAVFYWTRSIYANIAFHAVFNAIGIVAWWFATKG
jgi:membrane protease YdiL (CAAX protease family)